MVLIRRKMRKGRVRGRGRRRNQGKISTQMKYILNSTGLGGSLLLSNIKYLEPQIRFGCPEFVCMFSIISQS